MRILEPELLQSFLAIAETGSFTQAARRVNRTQSAVSMQMKRLEAQIERPLFLRNGRQVVLSADGELLLAHARRILRSHQEAAAAFDRSGLEGTVRLGTLDVYASALLPGLLARFAEAHPRVHVELVSDVSERLRERLAAGRIDLALMADYGDAPEGYLVGRDPLVWVGSARHCAHEREPLPLALFPSGCRYRAAALDALSRHGRDFRIAYTSMSLAGIGAAVRAGLAVSPLPQASLSEGMRALGAEQDFPPLPSYSLTLQRAPGAAPAPVARLEQLILDGCRGCSGVAAAA